MRRSGDADMVIFQDEVHRIDGFCNCSKCRAYRQVRYKEPAVRELSDKLQAARVASLGSDDPRCRIDDCIRLTLSQIDKK